MKKRLVQTLNQGDNTFGQVSHPDDLMKGQEFAHERLSDALSDFVNRSKSFEIIGFAYELGAENAFNIEIKKPGRIYRTDGLSFDLLADTTLTFDEADELLPRIDLIVAVLDEEVDAEMNLLPFVRLRTPDEFSEAVPPYPPSNINAPRELHWRAVPQIKTGTPASVPGLPVTASNEVPLYLVNVAPGATHLRDADVVDLREMIQTLRKLNELVSKNQIDLSVLTRRLLKLENLAGQPIDLSQIFGEIKTLSSILGSLQYQINASRDVPEIRYDRPKVPLVDKASSQIIATGGTAAGVPHVDIEIGGRVNFGDAEVVITPRRFVDQTVDPRFVTVGAPSGHLRQEVELTLDDVTQIAGDGYVDFLQRSSEFAAARGRPAAAARDAQFIEIFGGLASDNFSRLGDWLTYDLINDTLTEREPSVVLPTSDRPALFSYGDGANVLLIAGSESDNTPQVFRMNADTSVVTEITTTKPTGVSFFGDLISPGKIFIVATRKVGAGFETDFWEYDTATHLFTELGVTGSIPNPALDCAHGCYYKDDQFVMVTFVPGISSSGRTFVFDRSSLQWTELNIAQPFGDTPDKQLFLSRFRMANANGRPLLVGGLLKKDTDATHAKVWELKKETGVDVDLARRLAWQSWDATFPPVQDPGFCSGLGSDNMPTGKAFLFAGHGKYSDANKRIYSSVQGGLIAITFEGETGVSIADTATFVQFEIDPFIAAWEVAAYFASFAGRFDNSTLKAEVSLDDGGHWHEIDPNARTLAITDSDDPGVRRLRVTLYQNESNPPIVTVLTEVFDEDGGELEDRQVIRYNSSTADVLALYIDRNGFVTLSETITPSTSEKCLVHKVTPDGTDAPAVKNYINRRRAHIKYTGINGGGLVPESMQFENELAVPVRYVDARGVTAADNMMYRLDDPEVGFDELITLTDVPEDDFWIVELEG